MSRWVVLGLPWHECVKDGCRYLTEPGDEVIVVDPKTFTPSPGDIVMAPHLLKPEDARRFDVTGVTFYETENLLCPTNRWRTHSMNIRSMTTRPWLNYSAANATVFGDIPRPLEVRHEPPSDEPRDIDVLFIGSINSRRRTILMALQLMGINVQVVGTSNPLFFPELSAVLSRTKVLLNVHYYTPGVFESFRCVPALSHGCGVVTEVSEGNEGAEHCVVCNYEGLVNGVRDLLEEW